MAVVDFALNDDGDLAFVGGDLAYVSDLDGIAQLAKIALQTFLGEWFLDATLGVDWFGVVLVKNPDLVAIRNELVRVLSGVPGIVNITALDIEINADRSATIVWSALASLGALTGQTATVSP